VRHLRYSTGWRAYRTTQVAQELKGGSGYAQFVPPTAKKRDTKRPMGTTTPQIEIPSIESEKNSPAYQVRICATATFAAQRGGGLLILAGEIVFADRPADAVKDVERLAIGVQGVAGA
jgi:hypothetical protein